MVTICYCNDKNIPTLVQCLFPTSWFVCVLFTAGHLRNIAVLLTYLVIMGIYRTDVM